ncbi:hypothetical protein [Azospirillum picis]|uniref:Uncharacterized protein n=1 Tax=Azospirillum picis TaxID=488438 RepID=A0ABU0MTK6_9PROT|nr:hypothetical protein [Azospirillum picis]MBP2302815.1 hypothetical protein [Azospirillum picis]MDQ0536523.1 hypothetical protein [Azospirillum picis]
MSAIKINVPDALERLGLEQQDLADFLSAFAGGEVVSRNTVWRWCSADRSPGSTPHARSAPPAARAMLWLLGELPTEQRADLIARAAASRAAAPERPNGPRKAKPAQSPSEPPETTIPSAPTKAAATEALRASLEREGPKKPARAPARAPAAKPSKKSAGRRISSEVAAAAAAEIERVAKLHESRERLGRPSRIGFGGRMIAIGGGWTLTHEPDGWMLSNADLSADAYIRDGETEAQAQARIEKTALASTIRGLDMVKASALRAEDIPRMLDDRRRE